jgi:tRNA pseudouridine38-40 synthase
MPRYFLRIAYDGSGFRGWQKQPGGNTIQDEIDRALNLVYHGKAGETTGCGRTDTGVHASLFYLHFDLEGDEQSSSTVLRGLNALLPGQIACHELIRVHPEAHARYDATLRSYIYHIHDTKDPFRSRFSAQFSYRFNIEDMNEAATLLPTLSDFSSFCKAGSDSKSAICNVTEAKWIQAGGGLEFHISADRFLRNMVRALVGTMIDVGRGYCSLSEFRKILQSGNRSDAGTSAPACGLHLSDVKYPYLQMKP